MSGRMQTMAEIFTTRQADFARLVSERLTRRASASVRRSNRKKKNEDSLSKPGERLAVMTGRRPHHRAQPGRGEPAVDPRQQADARCLRPGWKKRSSATDCRREVMPSSTSPPMPADRTAWCVHAHGAPPLAIDAKFALESWQRMSKAAGPEGIRSPRLASGRTCRCISARFREVPDRRETQDTAFLFVPSESIFADIHEHFDDVVQRQRGRGW